MNAYLDSSVLLRLILRERGTLREWDSVETGVGSVIVEVECLRAIDRLRLAKGLSDEQVAQRREALYGLVAPMKLVELDRPVLARASQPFSTALRTLDAIHLVSALVWREKSEKDLTMATHDSGLATAARAHGMRVVGV
ncbi:MAG TPA: type II toxin-antitoxin system VapC family toxin [Thermoanaerobaculia bacterium]